VIVADVGLVEQELCSPQPVEVSQISVWAIDCSESPDAYPGVWHVTDACAAPAPPSAASAAVLPTHAANVARRRLFLR